MRLRGGSGQPNRTATEFPSPLVGEGLGVRGTQLPWPFAARNSRSADAVKRIPNCLFDGLPLSQDFFIPKAHDAPAILLEPFTPFVITVASLEVTLAVDFEDDALVEACEIRDEWPDRHLAADFVSIKSTVADLLPEELFRAGEFAAEAASELVGHGTTFPFPRALRLCSTPHP